MFKNIRIKRKIKKAEVINFGSTYAYYDFKYDSCNKNGINLANAPQYLPYDYKLLYKYISCIQKGTIVLFVFPDFVFLVDEEHANRNLDIYYGYLKSKEIYGFSWKRYLTVLKNRSIQQFRQLIKAILHYQRKNKKTQKEMALERLAGWSKDLGIKYFDKGDMDSLHKKNIQYNLSIVNNMLDLCKQNHLEVYFIVPPASELMRSLIKEPCLEQFLLKPLYDTFNGKVPILNYLYDEDFKSNTWYFNADCLNEDGARKFTKRVLTDIENLKMKSN